MMKILFVSSEVFPFAKTGKLADFAGSLPVALKQLGHDVRIVTPKYKTTDENTWNLTTVVDNIEVPISNRVEPCSILKGMLEEVIPVYFIKNDGYYRRDHLYGDSEGDYPDNAERFIYFSRSIPEVCKALGIAPDILHCNDWQSGLVPVYVNKLYQNDPLFAQTASIFTIHNLSYQGLFWHYDMHLTGLGWDLFTPDGLEYYGKINLMKGGLLWADILSTVSPTYSQEIQTKEFGHGLEGVLQYRSQYLYGVLNGVNYQIWNPETDPLIPSNYSPEALAGKTACKQALLKEFALSPETGFPLICMSSHLDDQKGCHLIAEIIEDLMNLDLYFILMGTGHEKYHKLFHHIHEKYPQKIGLCLDYDATLEHNMLAGADMFLIPSRYEPSCSLPMYSLKYGTIPIVRATGALNDTIKMLQPKAGAGTGIKFTDDQAQSLLHAITLGLNIYQEKENWNALQLRAMAEDFSWNFSAKAYETLYHKALENISSEA